jgi:hypothetical protein
MRAKLNWKRVRGQNGERMYELTGWEGVKNLDDLPSGYMSYVEPAVYVDTNGGRIEIFGDDRLASLPSRGECKHSKPWRYIKRGDKFTPAERDIITAVMRDAGARLSAILKEQRRAEWSGTVTTVAEYGKHKATLTCERVWEGKERRWKVIGWEGVPEYEMGGKRVGWFDWCSQLTWDINGLNNWHEGQLITTEVYDQRTKQFVDQLTAYFKTLAEKEAPPAPTPTPTSNLTVTRNGHDFTVSRGKHRATMHWRQEGEEYVFEGASGDFLTGNTGTRQVPIRFIMSTDRSTSATLVIGTIALPHQYRMWCAMFEVDAPHDFDTLEQREREQERDEWLSGGIETDEI